MPVLFVSCVGCGVGFARLLGFFFCNFFFFFLLANLGFFLENPAKEKGLEF